MEEEDAYQIMPYKEIVALRKDIESLKKSTDDSSFQGLLDSMGSLTKSMNSMLELFRTAAEEMKLEGKSEMNVAKEIGPLTDKMDTLIDQNKTIAEGLIAISDMAKDLKKPQAGPSPVFRLEPRRQPMPPPMQPQSPFEGAPAGPIPPGQAPPGHFPGPTQGPMGPPIPSQAPPGPMGPGPMPPGQAPSGPMGPPGPFPPEQAPPGQVQPPQEPLPLPEIPGPPGGGKKKGKFLGILKK